ncbi:MAG: D-alanyl-D-alanine carboxypeptidase [Lachnospiraceae bacterium]|nr:D-alanyl-D-alanine carboxypeptidase [Lachnospiraceae bacterium]
MRCTNRVIAAVFAAILCLSLTGCFGGSFRDAYDYKTKLSAFAFDSANGSDIARPFARDLCVVGTENLTGSTELTNVTAAGLFDVKSCGTLYAKNVHNQLAPASLTKTMTALLALKYGHLEDVITASANVNITEPGAQLAGLKEGDKLTLDQALHALLMYSGNDASVAIAEYISGSVDEFCNLMNREAQELGATNTHFSNPHGLSEDSHYTTAYDLYLIFNEAMKYDKFKEIIGMTEYTTSFSDRDGNPKPMTVRNSNYYITGEVSSPSNVSIIGGKTGTTNKAGSCLILLSNDQKGSPYISVILKAEDRDTLYGQMSRLLEQVP